jgi:hypothetical protein
VTPVTQPKLLPTTISKMTEMFRIIQSNIDKTRVINTNPRTIRNNKYIAIIEGDDINAILATPYDIIVVGAEAIEAVTEIVSRVPERAFQIVGAYCTTAEETTAACKLEAALASGITADFADVRQYVKLLRPQRAKSVPSSTIQFTIGSNEQFPTADDFMKSMYPTATAWKPSDARPNLHLFAQVWKPAQKQRLDELQTAFFMNANNPYVHSIHVSLDGDDAVDVLSKIPQDLMHKIIYAPLTERLTYRSSMEYMKTLPAGDFAALINTDIYFDESIRELWNMSMKNTCVSLLRYESSVNYVNGVSGAAVPLIFGPRSDSQDAWFFAVNDLNGHYDSGESWVELDFRLGVPGCDNAIAGELLRRRWNVVNPAFSIRALHLHESNERSYTILDRVSLGLYLCINPTEIY